MHLFKQLVKTEKTKVFKNRNYYQINMIPNGGIDLLLRNRNKFYYIAREAI